MTTLDERFESLRVGLESSVRPTAPVRRSTHRPTGRIIVALAAVAVIAIGVATVNGRNVKPVPVHVGEPSETADATYVVPSPAMEPAYRVGQRIGVTNKITNLVRGDVVLFRSAETDVLVLKRVIGLPGETVTIVDTRVAINGLVIDEPWLATGTTTQSGPYPTVVLATDEYFLLGDNRPNSNDSRFTGPVKRSIIVAKVTSTGTATGAGTESTSLPQIGTGPVSSVTIPASTEPPRSVPTTATTESVKIVDDVGRFAYHSISAFGSVWILGKSSGTVVRIEQTTGAIQATIELGRPLSAQRIASRHHLMRCTCHPIRSRGLIQGRTQHPRSQERVARRPSSPTDQTYGSLVPEPFIESNPTAQLQLSTCQGGCGWIWRSRTASCGCSPRNRARAAFWPSNA
jgi:signal peptidase I